MTKRFATTLAALALVSLAGSALAQGVPGDAASYRSFKTGGAFKYNSDFLSMDPVPAGKRLVMTNASCSINKDSNVILGPARLQVVKNTQYSSALTADIYGIIQYVSTETLTATFEGGPVLRSGEELGFFVTAKGGSAKVSFGRCTVFGYLQNDK